MPSPINTSQGDWGRHSGLCVALGLWGLHWDTLMCKATVITSTSHLYLNIQKMCWISASSNLLVIVQDISSEDKKSELGGLINRAGCCPLQAQRWSKSTVHSQMISGHYFPMSQKPEGLPNFPHTASSYFKVQVSIKVGRAAGGAAQPGKWLWRAASQGRRAEGGIQTATCFWGHKTCLYNDIFAITSVIQDAGLSKTLSFPGPLLGAPRRMELGQHHHR